MYPNYSNDDSSSSFLLNKIACIKLFRTIVSGTDLGEAQVMVEEFFGMFCVCGIDTAELLGKFVLLVMAYKEGKIEFKQGYFVRTMTVTVSRENFSNLIK